MTDYVYDEEASRAAHMDIVHEVVSDRPVSVTEWAEAMRRLNGIRDPLARRLIEIHRECGSGRGAYDDVDDEPVTVGERAGWGCETLEVIASHFRIDHPAARSS